MNGSQRRIRIGTLIGAHLLLGLTMALIAVRFPQLQEWAWIVVVYTGFVCCEILLFGMWLGLSTAPGKFKLGGLVAGTVWLAALCLAPVPFRSLATALPLLAIVGVPLLIVAASGATCRRWLAKLERRDVWKLRPISEELQFSLKSLIGLTVVISVLLGLARLVQLFHATAELVIVSFLSCAFALVAALATGMLIWASLGPGQAVIRVPIVIVALPLLGLLPPYSMGGGTYRYIVWPSLMAVIAAGTAGSLLVVRSCGYRLVSLFACDVQTAGENLTSHDRSITAE
jgi:hypothetical protein